MSYAPTMWTVVSLEDRNRARSEGRTVPTGGNHAHGTYDLADALRAASERAALGYPMVVAAGRTNVATCWESRSDLGPGWRAARGLYPADWN